jgi:hypothetical protein
LEENNDFFIFFYTLIVKRVNKKKNAFEIFLVSLLIFNICTRKNDAIPKDSTAVTFHSTVQSFKHRSRCFGIIGGHVLFFQRWTHCLISVIKVPDMQTYQSEHNMLLNFPRCLSILLLQTSKIDNNALDIDAIHNLKLVKT